MVGISIGKRVSQLLASRIQDSGLPDLRLWINLFSFAIVLDVPSQRGIRVGAATSPKNGQIQMAKSGFGYRLIFTFRPLKLVKP